MDEFESIRHWTAGRQQPDWLRDRGVIAGIGDDAAVLELPPQKQVAGLELKGPLQWLMAVDTMVETVHFNVATMEDFDIGYKALAANVSDIAAMGGVPLHALISVSVPSSYGPERMRRLYDGLYACAERYGVAIVGGDTTSSPQQLVVAVTVTGAVEAGRALLRSGARSGEAVFVTGTLGKSAAGLHWLLTQQAVESDASEQSRQVAGLVSAHCRPAPSVRAGRMLLARGSCRSLTDVSDGLASEAWEIAEASGLRLVLREDWLPRSGAMTVYAGEIGTNPLQWMLYGGEDYVLLGTIDKSDALAAQASFHAEGMPFYIIGETEEGEPAVDLIRIPRDHRDREKANQIMPIEKSGYNHFKR